MKYIGILAFGILVPLLTGLIYVQKHQNHGESLLVFCDVGQGDSAYIRLAGGFDVVVDGGRDGRAASCIDRYRFADDPAIDLILLTHADLDHYGGLPVIYKRFPVRYTILPTLSSNDASYTDLQALARTRSAVVPPPASGDILHFGNAVFEFLWPSASGSKQLCTHDRNKCSFVHVFTYHGFDALFTGDVTAGELERIEIKKARTLEVVKAPHHGSATGLTPSLVHRLNPQSAVLSAGNNNPYGHPDASIIRMLQGRAVYRTDLQGAIVFRLPRLAGQAD